MIYLLTMVIFHSYVNLPEGIVIVVSLLYPVDHQRLALSCVFVGHYRNFHGRSMFTGIYWLLPAGWISMFSHH